MLEQQILEIKGNGVGNGGRGDDLEERIQQALRNVFPDGCHCQHVAAHSGRLALAEKQGAYLAEKVAELSRDIRMAASAPPAGADVPPPPQPVGARRKAKLLSFGGQCNDEACEDSDCGGRDPNDNAPPWYIMQDAGGNDICHCQHVEIMMDGNKICHCKHVGEAMRDIQELKNRLNREATERAGQAHGAGAPSDPWAAAAAAAPGPGAPSPPSSSGFKKWSLPL